MTGASSRGEDAETESQAAPRALLLPVQIESGRCAVDASTPLNEPDSAPNALRMRVNETLREGMADLGLEGVPATLADTHLEGEDPDEALVQRAGSRWVFAPRLVVCGAKVRLRIVAVPPRSRVLLARSQWTTWEHLEMRAVVMLRDLFVAGTSRDETPGTDLAPAPAAEPAVERGRSSGNAILALNAALLGGFVGFALERISGSSDARLTYPLMALGAGVGLGASMVVAEEWDVKVEDAWYLSAGALWPTTSALLLASAYDLQPQPRYALAIGSATTGVGAAALGLAVGHPGSGGAALAHSGGALGLTLGGLAQLTYRGRTDLVPARGMGFGSGAGVLAAGTLAALGVAPSSTRTLLIDLGGGLGGLIGAAAASPILLDSQTEGANRVWLSSVSVGVVAGAITAALLTTPSGKARPAHDTSTTATRTTTPGTTTPSRERAVTRAEIWPLLGSLGVSADPRGHTAPIFGVGAQGLW